MRHSPRARAPAGTRRLGRSLALETALGLAVVGVTAVLVNTQPPAPASGMSTKAAIVQTAAPGLAQVSFGAGFHR